MAVSSAASPPSALVRHHSAVADQNDQYDEKHGDHDDDDCNEEGITRFFL